jgi:hypothetical protein
MNFEEKSLFNIILKFYDYNFWIEPLTLVKNHGLKFLINFTIKLKRFFLKKSIISVSFTLKNNKVIFFRPRELIAARKD